MLNTRSSEMVADVATGRATRSLVDGRWLARRALQGKAIVTGRVDRNEADGGRSLNASQVFIKLPELQLCPEVEPGPVCAVGQIAGTIRNEERCLIPSQSCTPIGVCPAWMPACDPGVPSRIACGG